MPEKLTPEQCKREVLRYLPQWFGIPVEVLDRYNYIWSGYAIWMTSVPLELLPNHKGSPKGWAEGVEESAQRLEANDTTPSVL